MANEKKLHELVKSGVWEIDSQGRIWNKDKGKRAECGNGWGYLQVYKETNGVRILTGAHRLVYHHFKGEIPCGMVINHINGIKNDNRPENLEAVTHSQNIQHAYRTGLNKALDGEGNPASKLTNKQVLEIREAYAIGGITQAQIAAKYGVSPVAISQIVRGSSRKTVGGETADYTSRGHRPRKLTNSQVLEIREACAIGGIAQTQIAAKYGVSGATISKIVRGEGRFAPKEVHHAN